MSSTFGFSLGWLLFITVILFALFYAKVFQTAEKSVTKESFDTTIIPDDKGIQEGQQRFNEFMNTINTSNPQIPLSSTSETQVNQALVTPTFGVTRDAKNAIGLPGVYVQKGATDPYKIPTGQPEIVSTAQTICEKVAQPDCSAFSDPNFAKQCGISFDKDGMDSRGQPHMGGLYISEADRTNQLQQAHRDGITIDRISYTPSLGKAKKGLFAIDASSCQMIANQQMCQTSMQLGPGCGQCYTSGTFSSINPKTPRIAPSLVIQTNASSLSITWGGSIKQYTVTPDMPMTIDVISVEGDMFFISVKGDPANVYFCGYLTAPTARGAFSTDLNSLIDVDTLTNYKPRIGGSQDINGVRCMIMRPGVGSGQMNLRSHLPFSFLSPYEPDARTCDNGPMITTQASADFLSSNPCFGSGAKPGSYSLECLQQLFLSLGGTTQGLGYPKDTTSAKMLLFDTKGQARSINDITTFLHDINIRASTGKDSTGTSLSISDWNQATMFVTGTSKKTACGDSNRDSGPLSKDCLQYLYMNGGYGTADGATYTSSLDYTSLDSNGNRIYCRPEGRLSPTNPDGLAQAQKAGGISAVKSLYDTAHKKANDNTLSNADRKDAILDCYGDTLVM